MNKPTDFSDLHEGLHGELLAIRVRQRQHKELAELERLVVDHEARQPERDAVDVAIEEAIEEERHRQIKSTNVSEQLRSCIPSSWGNKDEEFGYTTNLNHPLTFEDYQVGAKKTAIYNRAASVLYPALGLAGEVGELGEKMLQMSVHAGKVCNQVKKIIRDDDCECDTPRKHDIGKEIGGVLWYCAAICSELGLNLEGIAQENLDVLSDRQERGVLKGDGDNR